MVVDVHRRAMTFDAMRVMYSFVRPAVPWGLSSWGSIRTCQLVAPLRPCRTARPAPPKQNLPQMTAQVDSLGLPPLLKRYVESFAKVPDPKLRYQQLLFLAKELPRMDASLKTDENRVYGCTSLVHVHVSWKENGEVQLQGDSDSQLTKGLLALLINGLTGCKPQDIARINPQFITYSGLAASLTPSRNNGFVSMLAKIKRDVGEMEDASSNGNGSESTSTEAVSGTDEESLNLKNDPSRPMYSALMRKLLLLKPIVLDVIDNSAAHAGHAGAKGLDGESHFAVSVVAEAFEGLSMVQRHRLIYTLMNEEMSAGYIHALQIDARAPSEVAAQ